MLFPIVDAGWLETVDEYFNDAVKHILTTVTEELTKDPSKRFVWAESIYFRMWWKQASIKQQTDFRRLLDTKQVEFVNGGWVMSDDALCTYSAMLDQTTLGHQYLYDLFQEKSFSRNGWSIDPFGLSAVTAKINKGCGFDFHTICRVPYDQKEQFINDGSLEFQWQFDQRQGKNSKLFTHIPYLQQYGPMRGYDWDEPNPSPSVTADNVEQVSMVVVDAVKLWNQSYRSKKHINFMFGEDFKFVKAQTQFGNMSRIMDWVNQRSDQLGIKMRYSTPSEYFDAVTQDDIEYPTKTGDFFPYADNVNSYWTGYYSSHPEMKDAVRKNEHMLRNAEVLLALAHSTTRANQQNQIYNQHLELLNQVRSVNGEIQHHDAITGTEKDHVLRSYVLGIEKSIHDANQVSTHSILHLLQKNQTLRYNLLDASRGELFKVHSDRRNPLILFNSLGWQTQGTVRITVDRSNVKVTNDRHESIPIQVDDLGDSTFALYFDQVMDAISVNTVFITSSDDAPSSSSSNNHKRSVLSNRFYDVTLDQHDAIQSIYHKKYKLKTTLRTTYKSYESFGKAGEQASGAYIFRPTKADPDVISDTPRTSRHQSGNIYQQVAQQYAPYIRQTIKLHKDQDGILMDITIGPEIPLHSEIVLSIDTNIHNKGRMVTEDNGLINMHRQYRNSPLNESAHLFPASSNYYPFVYHAHIQDDDAQLVICTNTSRGIASLRDGQLEIMLHRRTGYDDRRGVNTPLNTTSTTHVQLLLTTQPPTNKNWFKSHVAHLHNYPFGSYMFHEQVPVDYEQELMTRFVPLRSRTLPKNVHLMNLNVKNQDELLFRLVNLEQDDDGAVVVNVRQWLGDDIEVSFAQETLLNGIVRHVNDDDLVNVRLEPLQIRTFVVKFEIKV
ncbi:lysosomal alpha-mannosidase [Acrasis kona]|uniref:Alpha-mannosidase n=1 Tax=Acrasis kona TaxID=1008807 RepID=A0AAW2YNT7_9EUKA